MKKTSHAHTDFVIAVRLELADSETRKAANNLSQDAVSPLGNRFEPRDDA
jgi:hypothetical protein